LAPGGAAASQQCAIRERDDTGDERNPFHILLFTEEKPRRHRGEPRRLCGPNDDAKRM
jgi:hypothetical protein